MRYPFQTFIATIFVFIFMGVVVASGELKIGKEIISSPKLTEATVKCAGNRSFIAKINQANLAKICAETCQIKANELLELAAVKKVSGSCLKEIIIKYKCANQSKIAYFYAGQEAELTCKAGQ
jgi:hypothetical protein